MSMTALNFIFAAIDDDGDGLKYLSIYIKIYARYMYGPYLKNRGKIRIESTIVYFIEFASFATSSI